ncbi:hypothetical protein B0O80DRAFT_270295 [Mortierella sp. GBAus27b]|nr:hypothetical protein B0O80DRAFT_270295 [Mortierella sp. GBAus27b]
MAHIPHALSLPEVTFRVAQYLERDDFTACSLVCKPFYASYAPYLWGNVHLGVLLASEKRTPTFSRLIEGSCWNNCEALVRQNSDSLRSLTLMDWGERFGDPHRLLWRPLDTCAQHTNLSTLKMQFGKLHEPDLEPFWTICRQLEILELTEIDLTILLVLSFKASTGIEEGAHHEKRARTNQTGTPPTHGTIPLMDGTLPLPTTTTTTTLAAPVRFPKLRELKLDRIELIPRFQMGEFILQCPMLHTLVWRSTTYKFSLGEFCDYFQAQTWPYLDSLEIIGNPNTGSVREHIQILQSTTRPFKFLDLHIGTMDQRSFDIVREGGYFKTLNKIDLNVPFLTQDHLGSIVSETRETSSKRIREVLESCPSLEHITGTAISGQDIIDSEPWACHRLKTFVVLISMNLTRQSTTTTRRVEYTEDEKKQCHQVFERLSQLRQLQVLDMRNPFLARFQHDPHATLPLDLRMGLGRLSTLKDLEWIGYQGYQNMRMVDMEWMLRHWSKLNKITGGQPTEKRSKTFGNTNVRCHLLTKALHARSVEIPMDWWVFGNDARVYMSNRGLKDVYDTDDDDEGEKE